MEIKNELETQGSRPLERLVRCDDLSGNGIRIPKDVTVWITDANGENLRQLKPASASTAAASGGGVASQRSRGRDECSLTPYYEASGCTIYHGDCRVIMPQLGPLNLVLTGFDLLLTDPPYGIGYNTNATKGRGTASKKWRTGGLRDYGNHEWDQRVADWVIQLARSLCTKQIIFGGNYYDLPRCKKWLVWDKESNGNFADCELAWTNLEGTTRRKRHLWNGFARAANEERFHPTQKPLAVMAWAIDEAGECSTVLDPWAGSGTTLVAAKAAGKLATGIEIEERYCEIAAKRLEQEVLNFTPSVADTQPTLAACPRGSRSTTAQADNHRI